MRVEPYRESEEATDEEAKEACAYAKDARNAYCWYSYAQWKEHFEGYEEPKKEDCTFMNGELFTNKIIVGRWGQDEDKEGEEEDIQEEEDTGDFRQRTNNRGRGWSGYGRGQDRRYDGDEYYQRRRNDEEGAPWVEGQRGRGFRARGRGGRRGTRGYSRGN